MDDVAEVIKAMGLGDAKRVTLRIDKLKALGFKPSMGSREAVRATAKKLVEEFVK